MYDPMTVAFEVKYPWRSIGDYRAPFVTIWHVDPERDGSDDSCGWFPRARHGSKEVIAKIEKRFASDWDRVFVSDETHNAYYCGFFAPDTGIPVMSPIGIAINLFFLAARECLGGRDAATKFMQKNLFEITLFAENPFDSMRDSVVQKFGSEGKRDERIHSMATMIYGWILRNERPWYKHPRWHFWHWQIQIHPYQNLRRFLLTRCCKCGKGFRYGESPCSSHWDSPKKRFLRGEIGLYHSNCNDRKSSGVAEAAKAP